MVGIIRTLGGGNGSNMVDQRVGDAYWVVNEVYKNLAYIKQVSERFNEFGINAATAIAAKDEAKVAAIQTAADRVQTALDVITTTAQAVIATTQAGLATTNGEAQVDLAEAQAALATAKAVLTAADRVQTGLDVIATAADRVQTGLYSADVQAAVSAGVGSLAVQTLAALNAITTAPTSSLGYVTNDSTSTNNGLYQWNGTVWTKSIYDPLTQAKNHTQEFVIDKLYNGFNDVIGSEIALNANYTTATATIAFAEPVGDNGHLSEINVDANRDGDLTILVLNKVGSDLIVEQSVILSVSASNVNYQLSEIIPVKSGQYIGFQSQYNFIKSLRDGGTYKATYPANGIVSSIPAIQSFNVISWQINFAIKGTAIVPQLKNLQQKEKTLSSDVGLLQGVVFDGEGFKIGVDSLTISSSTASKKYIPLASPITTGGRLMQVQLAATAASTVNFFTMKSIGGASFGVSRESSSFNVSAGISTIQLEIPLLVEAGEYIGWYSSNNAVCFVTGQNQTPYMSGNMVGDTFTSEGIYSVAQPQIQFEIMSSNLLSSKVLTQADYDALVIKDSQTLYFVVN